MPLQLLSKASQAGLRQLVLHYGQSRAAQQTDVLLAVCIVSRMLTWHMKRLSWSSDD